MAGYPRLVVDNSGGGIAGAALEKRRRERNPGFVAKLLQPVMNRETVREAPESAPVANPAGRGVELVGYRRGAAKGVDDLGNCLHGADTNSNHLKVSSALKLEMLKRTGSRIIGGMTEPQNQQFNPRSLEAIAVRLITLRESHGMSQTDFAKACEIATNTWNQYEKAVSRPDLENGTRISDRFQVTLDWIYFGEMAGMPYQTAERLRASAS